MQGCCQVWIQLVMQRCCQVWMQLVMQACRLVCRQVGMQVHDPSCKQKNYFSLFLTTFFCFCSSFFDKGDLVSSRYLFTGHQKSNIKCQIFGSQRETFPTHFEITSLGTSSVTRCFEYFSIFGLLFDQLANEFAKVGSKFCQILKVFKKNCLKTFKIFQSCEISPNLVTLVFHSLVRLTIHVESRQQ